MISASMEPLGEKTETAGAPSSTGVGGGTRRVHMDRIREVLARQPIVVTDHGHAAAFKRRVHLDALGYWRGSSSPGTGTNQTSNPSRLQREQPAHSRVTGRTSPVGVWERLMGAKSFR